MNIKLQIPVLILDEGSGYSIMSPVLDIATQGKTIEESKTNFSKLLKIFFKELEEMGTLEEVLLSMGWKKVNHSIEPPKIVNQTVELVTVNA